MDFENLLKNETNHDSFEGINNFDIEDPEYFKRILEFYSPYQMSEQEMKMLLKKACLASIKEKDKDGKIIDIAASNARIKHLEPLWTLGRFYGIHNYALDFIGRPMPSQAVMQFSGIVDSPFLSCDVKNLDVLIKSRTIRIGHHNYPLEDALIALYDNSKLLSLLDAKSNEIIPGKIQNIYKPILENVQKKYPKHSLVATLDYSGDKLRNLARKYPGFLKALIFLSSIPDFFLKYKTEIENHTPPDGVDDNDVFLAFLFDTMMLEGVENKKNLFFITMDEFDNRDLIVAAIILIYFCNNINQISQKDSSKQCLPQT